MFTGLVEDVGRVVSIEEGPEARTLVIAPAAIPASELGLGDSIAIDGTCLTVTAADAASFRVVAAFETLRRTTLGELTAGARVNLERALRASDRLGGHIVAGHVDGVGRVRSKTPVGDAVEVVFEAPPELLRYVVEKGSIAVDGISLTVNAVDDTSFTVGLIPHTLEVTTLGGKAAGGGVNLEVDLVGKYVEKLVAAHLAALPR